jgi:hypothetical protein
MDAKDVKPGEYVVVASGAADEEGFVKLSPAGKVAYWVPAAFLLRPVEPITGVEREFIEAWFGSAADGRSYASGARFIQARDALSALRNPPPPSPLEALRDAERRLHAMGALAGESDPVRRAIKALEQQEGK